MAGEEARATGSVTAQRVREMMRAGVPDRRIAKRLGLSRRGLAMVMDEIVTDAKLADGAGIEAVAERAGLVEP